MRNGFGALKHTANREHAGKPRKAHCDTCGALLNGSAAKPQCERCSQRFAAAQQRQESESEDTKMSDSMSQADEEDGDSETSEEDSGGYSSTSLSSGERNAPAYSSGGTPSTNLKHRITRKAQLQKHETITDKGDSFAKVPTRPMMELEAGANVWYQAYVLKESKNEVKVRFPAIEPSDEEKVEWVRKGSSRIWTGSYHSNQWRHLGKGAWAPRAKPKASSRRLGGRVRRKTQSQGGGGQQQHRRRKVSGENSALQTEQSTRTTPANAKDDESQQQENEIMSPAPAAKQQLQQEKGSYSQNVGPAPGAGTAGAHADDGQRENSSKRMSSDEIHAQYKGSGVQGDQVSAKSNPSDFDGFFHSDHEDAEEQERLTDTAEYDPLAKWFEVHFTQLQAAGTLAAQLPGSNPEAGILPPGFVYNRSSKQIVQAQLPVKRPASSRQEASEGGRGAAAVAGQEAGGSGSEGQKASKRPCTERHGSDDNSKPGMSAGGSAGQHRSRGAYAGLRELQGLSMWGWDHADHSTHDLIEIPTKRLRGQHHPSNLQPSVSLPTAPRPTADSPPATSTSLPLPPPPPAAEPPTKHPPQPATSLSRHQSSNSSKPPPPGPLVPPPPDTGTCTAAPAPAPPRNADPPPKPEPPARPPPDPPTRSQPNKPRKRALIVSSDESDGEPDPPAPRQAPAPKPKQAPPTKPPSKLPPLPSALSSHHDPNNLQPSRGTALKATHSSDSRTGGPKASANGGPARQQRPLNGAVVLSSLARNAAGGAAGGAVKGSREGGQRGPQGKGGKGPGGPGGASNGKPLPPSRMGGAGQKLRS